jgi:hypothetical protein
MNRYKINDNDQAVGRAFPNARASVLLVPGITNKTLLKNPYRTQSEPVGVVGVDKRPWSITTDIRGNVFARSSELLEPNITNINLLQNPYRTKTDPIDEPRVLTAQTIKDIGAGIFPKYIAEDRGINEVAYIILKGLHDDGVKLITISLLKSMITGKKITELLGKSQNQTMRALQFFDKLMSDATQLYKDNLLNDRLDELLAEYSKAIQSIYGPEILRSVPRAQVQEEIRKLGEISGVLSRMFRAQNQLEPGRLVPYETLMNLPANPTPPIPQNTGDNEPSPPQEIKEPDNIRDINDPRTPANQVTPDISELPPDIFSGPAGPSAPPSSAAPRRADNPFYEVGEEEKINELLADIKQRPTRTGILGNALAVAGGIGKGALSLVRGVNVDNPNVPYLPVKDLFSKNIPVKDLLKAFPVAPAGVLNAPNRPNLALLDNNVNRRTPVSADDNDQVINADIAALRAAQAQRRRLQEEAMGEVAWLTRKGAATKELTTQANDLELAERAQDLAERRQQLRERQAAFEKSKKSSASPAEDEPLEDEPLEDEPEEKYAAEEDIKRRLAREAHIAELQQNPFDIAGADEGNALKFIQNIRTGKRPQKEDPVRVFDMTDKRVNTYFGHPEVNYIAPDIIAKAANKTALQIALSQYFKNLLSETFTNSIMNDYLYLIAKLTPAAKGGLTEAEGGFPKTIPANSNIKLNYLLEWLDYSFGRDKRGELGINEAWTPEVRRLEKEIAQQEKERIERWEASQKPEAIKASKKSKKAKESKKVSAGEGRKCKTTKVKKSTRPTKNSKSLDAQILSLLKE